MPHPVMSDVKAILDPYHPRIRNVVELAWSEFRKVAELRVLNGIAPVLYSRTISNDVFDAIARYAIKEFANDSSVHVKIETQTIKLFFKGGVFARFKRGDDNRLGQSIPTQAAMAFEDADGQLPGFPPETAKVEFIWLSNDLSTRLDHVLVVARHGNSLLWDYEIEKAAGSAGGTIIPFPEPPPPDLSDDNLVKPKKPEVKKPEENE
ncbi:hypothetical protein [Rhodoplanes serenus]|uniref:hypothetical protein n=1 Tax=Rhodoplanes serenus TaxID=200615 RepID=UPI0011B93DCB|nr:hypothetical protein [Rhodoplanes serenus]